MMNTDMNVDVCKQNSYEFMKCYREREAYLASLGDVGASAPTAVSADGLPKAQYSEEEPEVGQIRLLAGTSEMLEVLLYRHEKDRDVWMVIPLSDIPYPATEMEATFRTPTAERDSPRTYRFWGMFMYPDAALRYRSWLMDSVSREELRQVESLMLGFYACQPIPTELKQLCGSPITLPMDPRYGYEETADAVHQSALDAAPALQRAACWQRFADSLTLNQAAKPMVSELGEDMKEQLSRLTANLRLRNGDASGEVVYAAATDDVPPTAVMVSEDGAADYTLMGCLDLDVSPEEDERDIAEGAPVQELFWPLKDAAPFENGDVSLCLRKNGRLLGACEVLGGKAPCIRFPGTDHAPEALRLPDDLMLVVTKYPDEDVPDGPEDD